MVGIKLAIICLSLFVHTLRLQRLPHEINTVFMGLENKIAAFVSVFVLLIVAKNQ
jgi:hypothetical protein